MSPEISVSVAGRFRPAWRWHACRLACRLHLAKVALWLADGTRLEMRVDRGPWEEIGLIKAGPPTVPE
jgi:hypothetical protein